MSRTIITVQYKPYRFYCKEMNGNGEYWYCRNINQSDDVKVLLIDNSSEEIN